jgi:hexosaminidase
VFDATAAPEELGAEGYEIRVRPTRIDVVARSAAGFAFAVQTILQALPTDARHPAAPAPPATVPTGTIRDFPRFAWRGVMLDVARHFFTPREVRRVIDLAAQYKLNRFHLHLTDDQGWRIEITAHPELTAIGGRTAIGGGPGGFYTQDEYRGLVEYAARRGVVVVPEIDVPGHTQAALASLPWLNCDGVAREINTEWSSLTSTLCVEDERSTRFVETVLGEVAALTSGSYLHVGADESTGTGAEAYRDFVARTADFVRGLGKVPLVWEEAAIAPLGRGAIAQFWLDPQRALDAAAQDTQLVMSPANRAYLDMKYDASTPVGIDWAGFVDTRTAYEWDPVTHVTGLDPSRVVGLEAPVWTETMSTIDQVERMLLPRLPAYAELGWSSPEGNGWDGFRARLADHGPRWDRAGHAFTRDPGIDWP